MASEGKKKFVFGSKEFNRWMRKYRMEVAQFCLDFNCRVDLILTPPNGENPLIIGTPSENSILEAANLYMNSLPVPLLSEAEKNDLRTFLDQMKAEENSDDPTPKKAKKNKSINGGGHGKSAHGPKDNDASGSGKGCSI